MDAFSKMAIYAGIFLLLAYGFFMLFRSIVLREGMKIGLDKLHTKLASRDNKRIDEIEAERRMYGSVIGKESGAIGRFLTKVDNMLIYSGASIRHKWLNTSSFLALYIVCGGLMFIFVLFLSNNLILALLVVLFVLILPVFKMTTAADNAYRSVETQMSLCVNLVANMGDATNSIMVVLREIAPYMSEPLRTTIYRAISTANLTGVEGDGIRQLCREIEHPMFVQFIRHLEISAKNEADFRNIARDYSGQVDMAIRAAQRQKAIFANGRGSILLLMGVGILLICMLLGMLGDGIVVMLAEMSQNAFGILVLIVTCILYVSAILYMMLGMRR